MQPTKARSDDDPTNEGEIGRTLI